MLFSRSLLLALLALMITDAYGAVTSLAREGKTLFQAGKYQKVARLSTIGKADLAYATKAENVQGLLDLAAQENRIDAIQQIQLSRRYSSEIKGDEKLLVCLKVSHCKPENFIKTINLSELHADIAIRQPGYNQVQVNHAVGEVTESLMAHYFKISGWTQIQGQIGRQGIDGLFVKLDGDVIKDVLVVESKYSGSKLGMTNHGTQMSETWVRKKLFDLRAKYPDEKAYQDIEKFVDAGTYRAMIWNMNVENNSLKISLDKVKSKGADVVRVPASGSESRPLENEIKLTAPINDFEKNLVSHYNKELLSYGPQAMK